MAWKDKFRNIFDYEFNLPDWLYIPDPFRYCIARSRILWLWTWTYAYYTRFLTVPGRLIITAAFLIVFYTLILIRTPVLILTFALLALFFVDFVLGLVFRPKVIIKRNCPNRVGAGCEFQVTYELQNKRLCSAWNLIVDGNNLAHGIHFIGGAASIECLESRDSVVLNTKAVSPKRGKHILRKPLVESAFPFHIFKWSCREKETTSLLVCPRHTPLLDLTLPVGRRFQKMGSSMVSKVGESLDIHGCREFRVGDDPRHIHWGLSAKSGDLITREFQQEYLTRIGVIMDTFVPRKSRFMTLINPHQEHVQLEAAVSLTAGIAEFLTRGDYVIDIFAAGPEVYHLQGGRNLAPFEHVVDILAQIGPGSKTPIADLSPTLMDEIAEIGSVIVILLKWDAERELMLTRLKQHGIRAKVVMIDCAVGVPGESIVHLTSTDIQAGNVKRL